MIDRIAVWLLTACPMMAGTVGAASNIVRINYDAAGNIVAIERVHVAPIAPAGSDAATGATGALVLSERAVASTGGPPSIDMPGKAIARVNAQDGAPSASTSHLVARQGRQWP